MDILGLLVSPAGIIGSAVSGIIIGVVMKQLFVSFLPITSGVSYMLSILISAIDWLDSRIDRLKVKYPEPGNELEKQLIDAIDLAKTKLDESRIKVLQR